MAILGEIKRGYEIGRRGGSGWANHIWSSCAKCGKERWVQMWEGKPRAGVCKACTSKDYKRKYGEDNPCWRGGRYVRDTGYVMLKINPDDAYIPMTTGVRMVGEHRLVMAKYLGRCLKTKEVVHHLNGDRGDNRIENLAIVTPNNHERKTLITQLQSRVRELEQRTVLL